MFYRVENLSDGAVGLFVHRGEDESTSRMDAATARELANALNRIADGATDDGATISAIVVHNSDESPGPVNESAPVASSESPVPSSVVLKEFVGFAREAVECLGRAFTPVKVYSDDSSSTVLAGQLLIDKGPAAFILMDGNLPVRALFFDGTEASLSKVGGDYFRSKSTCEESNPGSWQHARAAVEKAKGKTCREVCREIARETVFTFSQVASLVDMMAKGERSQVAGTVRSPLHFRMIEVAVMVREAGDDLADVDEDETEFGAVVSFEDERPAVSALRSGESIKLVFPSGAVGQFRHSDGWESLTDEWTLFESSEADFETAVRVAVHCAGESSRAIIEKIADMEDLPARSVREKHTSFRRMLVVEKGVPSLRDVEGMGLRKFSERMLYESVRRAAAEDVLAAKKTRKSSGVAIAVFSESPGMSSVLFEDGRIFDFWEPELREFTDRWTLRETNEERFGEHVEVIRICKGLDTAAIISRAASRGEVSADELISIYSDWRENANPVKADIDSAAPSSRHLSPAVYRMIRFAVRNSLAGSGRATIVSGEGGTIQLGDEKFVVDSWSLRKGGSEPAKD